MPVRPLFARPTAWAVLIGAVCASAPVAAPFAATATASPAAAKAEVDGIAWVHASSDADVDAAFERARSERKPLFLYWGAKWCPPCNQVKSTLFNRADFIARSRAFVPVYIDGDSPGAQKLGTRFKVRGYPTMVLFKADGTELTRLPGEVDAAQYTQVLTLGMNAKRPVKTVLAEARAGGAKLTPNDWRMLAFYAWEVDEQQVVPKAELPVMLKTLAANCPARLADTSTRLLLKSLAASDGQAPAAAPVRQRVLKLLATPADARAQMDVLSNQAPEITRALSAPGSAERTELLARYDAALQRFARDAGLSRADRLTAQLARVQLARIDQPKNAPPSLPPALVAELREQVARDDREISNGYERQAVITTGAYVLTQAGLGEASDALLKANLTKSHSPYYLMSALASNAKARGDAPEALRWYEEAYQRSEGPATRLQWGASYVTALVELAPQDAPRIERAAQQVLADAAKQPDAFYERSGRSLQRLGKQLSGWAAGPGGAAAAGVVERLQGRLDGLCRALPAAEAGARAACEALLKDGKAA